jgi:farnesyl diphosphate synthase
VPAARERRDRLAQEAIAALDKFPQGRNAEILKEAARFAVSRKS